MAMSKAAIVAGLRAIAEDGQRLAERMERSAMALANSNRALEQMKHDLKLAQALETDEETNLRAMAEAEYALAKERKEAPKGTLTAGDAAGRKAQMDQWLFKLRTSGAGTYALAAAKRQHLEQALLKQEADFYSIKIQFDAMKAVTTVYPASAELFKTAANIEALQQIEWMGELINLLRENKEQPNEQ